MSKPVPIKLPSEFDWVETTSDEGGMHSMALKLFDRSVLRVVPMRAGWLVVIDLQDPRQPQADIAVPSIAAGMRWAARWVQGRIDRLHAINGTGTDIPALRRSRASWASWNADRLAHDRGKPVAIANDDG